MGEIVDLGLERARSLLVFGGQACEQVEFVLKSLDFASGSSQLLAEGKAPLKQDLRVCSVVKKLGLEMMLRVLQTGHLCRLLSQLAPELRNHQISQQNACTEQFPVVAKVSQHLFQGGMVLSFVGCRQSGHPYTSV